MKNFLIISVLTLLIHILFLIYFVKFGRNFKKKRKMNVVEATAAISFPYEPVLLWGIGFLQCILVNVVIYIDLVKNQNTIDIISMRLEFTTLILTIIIFIYTRWNIELKDDVIIIQGYFKKKIIHYSDITEIKQTMFTYKFLSNKKPLFSLNVRYHHFDLIFVEKIRIKMQNNIP